jgi:hypothetical protein
MNILTEMLTQQLAGGAIAQISNKLGVDQGTAGKAVAIALPLLIAALARNTSTPSGANALDQAVARDHDGSILDDIGGFLNSGNTADGAGILGHVFGNQQNSVEGALAQRTGLDAGSAGQLLAMVAPLVLGAVGKTRMEQGLDANSLSAYLGDQHQAQNAPPDMMGMLGGFLDANQDGSVVDDLGRLAGKVFGK